MPNIAPSRSIFSQLDSLGEEYTSVRQYLASCLLQKGKIEGVTILKIDNPDLTARFEKRGQKLLKLIGWSNLQTLQGDNNDLSLLGKRGFVFAKGSGGLDFITGNINSIESAHALNKSNKSIVEVHEPEHTFVFSDIAIGRSYVLDHDWSSTPLPEGYDSFYMPHHKLDVNDDGEFDLFEYQQAASFDSRDPSNYEHKYFVRDTNQILPRYVIRFKFVNEGQKKAGSIVPDSSVASASAQAPGKRSTVNGNTLDDFDFFDPESHRPVTMRQKMKIAGAKLIIPVEQAFEQALVDWKRDDPLIEGKKAWLEGQLDSIDERVRQVNLNYADVLEKIQETAAAATAQLQLFTKAKLDTLLSAEVELRRQKEQMLWMDSLVVKNFKSVSTKIDAAHSIVNSSLPGSETPSTVTPISHADMHAAQRAVTDGQLEFLQIWKHHTTFRNAASRLKPLQHLEALNQVKPDIAVKTDLSVYIDQSVSRGGNASGPSGIQTPGAKAKSGDIAGRPAVTATEADKQAMKDTLSALQKNNNYSQPPRPSEELLSHLLQSVIDVETGRIQEALSEALKEDRIPLPASLHRPSVAGVIYASRELLDLLQPPMPSATNNEMINHKELYYASMKSAIGHAPATAKARPKPVEKHHHNHSHSLHDLHDKSKPSSHHHGHHQHHHGSRHGHNEKKMSEEQQQRTTAEMLVKQAKAQEEQRKAEEFEQHRIWQEQQATKARKAADDEKSRLVLEEEQEAKIAYQFEEQGLTDPALRKGMTHLVSTPSVFALKTLESAKKAQLMFSYESLQRIAAKFKEGFSLTGQANRRMAQIKTEIVREEAESSVVHLSSSQLLTPAEAQVLYYNLPFFAKPPGMSLLYSSAEKDGNGEGLNLEEFYTASMMSQHPSLLIIQSGQFVFGAYLTHPLRVTSSGWAGSPACFMYSVTLDVKMPYHARNPPANASFKKPVAFIAERDKLCVGNGDLIINDGGFCHSDLENCYGMGLTFGSSEAGCFLAGQNEFSIDELELWAVTP